MDDRLTAGLAIWGAVVSTIALGWNIRQGIRDRSRLKVQCSLGRFVAMDVPSSAPQDPTLYLVYRITNTGKYPVVVTSVGWTLKDGSHFVVNGRALPRKLGPGEYVMEKAIGWQGLLPRARALWALDAEDREYRFAWRPLRRLKKEAASVSVTNP